MGSGFRTDVFNVCEFFSSESRVPRSRSCTKGKSTSHFPFATWQLGKTHNRQQKIVPSGSLMEVAGIIQIVLSLLE
ncbi:hypothetical protein CEXT_67581 [Caerostris extrusa]|uniref:Uncharacterized protein n=1 Tax=Caerostris extrusa TaxID=172846 RepID=A0AAV4ML12_CAEEX|nr:hypothetical protein CEXT_67581 [Caerostris extrusa]